MTALTPDGKLKLFEEFVIDRELPKHKKERPAYDAAGEVMMTNPHTRWSVASFGEEFGVVQGTAEPNASSAAGLTTVPKRPWEKVLFWRKDPAKDAPDATMTIEQFFRSVHNSAEELQIVDDRARGYEQAMIKAKRAGQTALCERLADGLNAAKMEVQLLAIGLPKYISEENLVTFYKQSKKGLRFDWVRHFVRHIPMNVVEKKEQADELHIFDNYVVLHYDPQTKAFAETAEDKAAKKDPVLFGVMKGRRVLYFVGDWIDEVCDLTLDQIADTLGKGAIGSLESDLPAAKSS